jgi:peptidoglycan hydrolase CwlO-like protein
MKLMTVVLFGILSISLMTLASAEKVKSKAKETVDATKEYTYEKKTEFETKIRSEVTELDAKIEELSHKAKSESKDQLERIRARRDELEKKLGEISKSSSSAWGEVKSGVLSAVRELETSLKKAKEKF